MERVDIRQALAESEHALSLWYVVRKHPDSQPFSGGVFDAWPAWGAEVIAICRDEEFEIRRFQQNKEQAHG